MPNNSQSPTVGTSDSSVPRLTVWPTLFLRTAEFCLIPRIRANFEIRLAWRSPPKQLCAPHCCCYCGSCNFHAALQKTAPQHSKLLYCWKHLGQLKSGGRAATGQEWGAVIRHRSLQCTQLNSSLCRQDADRSLHIHLECLNVPATCRGLNPNETHWRPSTARSLPEAWSQLGQVYTLPAGAVVIQTGSLVSVV